MIKRSKQASPGRRVRDGSGRASDELLSFIKTGFDGKIPLTYLTAITKKYNKVHCLHEEDKFLQRFVEGKGFVSTTKLADYLQTNMARVRGQPLSDDSVRRVYNNCANPEGKLTMDSIMRMGEQCGVSVSEKEAREMIRKYGHRKQFLSVDDCLGIN
jgi:hypothetical protein